MQKGEQASSCGSSPEVDFVSEWFPLSSVAKDASSAQGIALKDSTRIAIKNAKIFFTGAKVVLNRVKYKSMFVQLL